MQFGREVTPNHHALAEQFVLFDNLYDSGSLSADGHQWVTQAFAPDYIEKAFGGFTRTYPFNGGDALAYAPSGFLWDNALRHDRSVRVYGEYVNGLRATRRRHPGDGTVEHRFLGHGVTEAGVWTDFYRDAQLLAAGRDSETARPARGPLGHPVARRDHQQELPAVPHGHPRPVPGRGLPARVRAVRPESATCPTSSSWR